MQILTRRNKVIDYCSDGYMCMGCTVVCESKGLTFEDCTVVTVDTVPVDIDSYDYYYKDGVFIKDTHQYSNSEIDALLDGRVPITRTVNGKELSDNVELTPADLSAAALNSDGKVDATQASSTVIDLTDSLTAAPPLGLEHVGKFVRAVHSVDITIRIPPEYEVAWPDGAEIEICRWSTPNVTIAGDSGVTVYSLDDAKSIVGRFGCACLKKVGADVWILSGALE